MAQVVYTFKNPSAQKPSLSGSKGASLAKMSKSGLPVPPGFIIATQAFQPITRKISAELKIIQNQKTYASKKIQNASENIGKIILEHTLSPDIVSQITKAYAALGKPAVSVRSSSTAEDLANASFAGQYDTYLNVTNIEDLIHNLKKVWISLYSPHAIGYRQRNNIPNNKAKMAVVVQQQLSPSAAGVLFTQDPISGEAHYVVSAALGLGEGVVSGTSETDRFILHAKTGKRLSADIAHKKTQMISNKNGGIETVPVAKTKSDKPALTQKQLTQLAKYGRQLAKQFKCPQDIEFAVTGQTIHILQSRPMTAIEPAIDPDEPWDANLNTQHHWQSRGGPYMRLEQDYVIERLKEMRVCYEETGSSMSYNHIPHVANGHIFARSNKHSKQKLAKLHAQQTRRVNASLKKGKSYFEDALQSLIEDRLAELKQMRKAVSNFSELVTYLEAAIKTCAYVQGNLHWRQGKPGGRTDWPSEYHKITGRPPLEAHTFTQAVQNRMTRLITRIRDLARIAQKDPVLKKIFINRKFDDLTLPNIQKRKQTKLFMAKFQSMLRVYGLRAGYGYGTSSNFTTQTWNMNNTLAYDMIASYVEQNLNRLDKLEHEARQERVNAIRRTRQQLADAPNKLKRFDKGLKEAIIGVRFLEDHNYYMEQCTMGTMREAVHQVGQEMVAQNLIDTSDDVCHFSVDELKKIAQDKTPNNQRAFVQSRKEERERRKKMNAPKTLGKTPKKSESQNEAQKEIGLQGNVIKGASASKGRVTGKAVVALPNQPRPKVHPGDILVAPNVGPDWTPAFAIIGGLVLDSGSLSQHAALVAREYRIPSVMQTRDASGTIQNDQIITVDGDNGIVELVS